MTSSTASGGGRASARPADAAGIFERGGIRISWERYGEGEPAVFLLPTWSIVHSRCWKMQVSELSRRHRVLVCDPRGNGASDRPTDPAAYAEDEFAADALAVMDASRTEAAVVVGLSLGAQRALILAGEHPGRVRGLVLVAPFLDFDEEHEGQLPVEGFRDDAGVDEGWRRYNEHSWRRDYRGFVEFFFSRVFTEAHSTKQREDCVGWGLESNAETLVTAEVPGIGARRARELCARVSCPVLVVHGDEDEIVPHEVGVEAAALSGGRLITFAGAGHLPNARDPVRFNLAITDFIVSLGCSPLRGDR